MKRGRETQVEAIINCYHNISTTTIEKERHIARHMSEAHHATGAEASLDAKLIEKTFRQVATYGMDTMAKLVSIRVLILGCRGVGAESAKNLALAGVHTVTLLDPTVCCVVDQSDNFAITADHIASRATRADATAHLVRQLNPNCRVRVAAAAAPSSIDLHHHDVVIVTSAYANLATSELARINDVCRRREPTPASFMVAFSAGPIGTVFVDNGPGFVTRDPDGRDPLQKAITEIVHHRVDKMGRSYSLVRFTVPEGMRPGGLRDYTELTFSDVTGLIHQATSVPIAAAPKPFFGVRVNSDAPSSVRIYPSLKDQGYTEYQWGGFIHEVKQITKRGFRTLVECLATPPPLIFTDPAMDGAAEGHVHFALAAMLAYAEKHSGALPALLDDAAADEVVLIARQLNTAGERLHQTAQTQPSSPQTPPSDPLDEWPTPEPAPVPPKPFLEDMNEAVLKRIAALARTQLQPLATLLGAIVSQEVVKMTGKFTPVYQMLHFNFVTALPDEQPRPSKPHGTDRYDDLRLLYGENIVEQLSNSKVFMVGCGALGCEYIKNFALCGVCCGPKGRLTVTDNDKIEVSNLNRQFLFREENIGQYKSTAAAKRALEMNAALRIDPRTDFVSEATEHLFPDAFWSELDFVTNALDNMPARLYVDDHCVLFEKVLLEAGTMGTGGNVDIIVPHKTSTYADGGAADDTGGIPMCTLRNFPYIYDHCIEWARAQFDDLFVSPIMSVEMLRENPEAFAKKMRDEVMGGGGQSNAGQRRSLIEKHMKTLREVLRVAQLLSRTSVTMEECVELAWKSLHAQFRDRIQSLIRAFPRDAKKSNGTLFWSGHHKFPSPIDAHPETDNDVFQYLIAAANLYACMLGVHEPKHPPHLNNPHVPWKAEYRSREWLVSVCRKLPVPEVSLAPVDDLDEESAAAATTDQAADADTEKELMALLDAVCVLGREISPKAQLLEFEKDDDENFHIDFVMAAANLRARNYDIPTKDRVAVKLIAGKIIPAIATTTAAVTAIALIEYFKVLLGKDVSQLRNGFIDLGSNTWTMFDRDPPKRITSGVKKTYYPEQDYTEEAVYVAYPDPHTVYSKLWVEVTPSTTMAQFGEALLAPTAEAREGPYEIAAVGVGQGRLWDGSDQHLNKDKPLLELIAKQLGKDPVEFWKGRERYHRLTVNLETAEGNEVIPATIVLSVK